MSKIILPSELGYFPTKAEKFRHQQYLDNPDVKNMADKIHQARLIAGPAEDCDQCIHAALIKLGLKSEE